MKIEGPISKKENLFKNLNELVGKKVKIMFNDGSSKEGELRSVSEHSSVHGEPIIMLDGDITETYLLNEISGVEELGT